MAQLCMTTTLAAVLPSSIKLLLNPTKHFFLLSLINSSLAFFLFSFQVHEKSILIVTLPIILNYPLNPNASVWFLMISTFSMFPLLHKDNLLIPYIALNGIYLLILKFQANFYVLSDSIFKFKVAKAKNAKKHNFVVTCFWLSIVGSFVLVLVYLFVEPPESLPFLFSFLVSAYSCVHFIGFFLYFNYLHLFKSNK